MIPRPWTVPLIVAAVALSLSGCAASTAGEEPAASAESTRKPTTSPTPTPTPEERTAFDGDCESALSLDEVSALLGAEAEPLTLLDGPAGSGDLMAAWDVLACEWSNEAEGAVAALYVVPEEIAGGGFTEGVECGSLGYDESVHDTCRLTMRTEGSWSELTVRRNPVTADVVEAIAGTLRERVDADGGPVMGERLAEPWSALTCQDLEGALVSLGHRATPGYPAGTDLFPSPLGDAMEAAGAALSCGWDGDLPVEVTLQVHAGEPSAGALDGWGPVEVEGADAAWYRHEGTSRLVAVRGDNRMILHSHSDTTEADLIPVAEAMLVAAE